MHTKRYGLTLIAFGAALFAAVVAANLVIDPQGVFGTGLLPRSANVNDRYESVVAFERDAAGYDGLVFGSSRARGIALDALAARLGGVRLARFAVDGGMLNDHLPELEFVLREKGKGGAPIRSVFLMLDVDGFARRPFTGQSLQFATPPQVSGEPAARFWWRNLTAIQPRAWRSALAGPRGRRAGVPARQWESVSLVGAAQAQPRAAAEKPAPAPATRITGRIAFPQHMQQLARFVALCRAHGIALLVATSPVRRLPALDYGEADLAAAVEAVARVVPVWDFSTARWLSDHPELWLDQDHFGPLVGQMMLKRMFGEPLEGRWQGFGRRVTGAQAAARAAKAL